MKKFLPLFLISLFVSAHSSAQELRYGITGAMNVASYAMDVDGILGSITVGKKANVFITKEVPSYEFLPYSFSTPLVDTVILNGKII